MITIQYLQGTMERFDETIRHLVARNWNKTMTEEITPKFLSPQGQDANPADTAKTKSGMAWEKPKNQDYIRIHQGNTLRYRKDLPTGTKNVRMITTVFIDIFAQTPHRQLLFEEQINDIIQNNQPNLTTRIKKSNNTENSAISNFDRTNIEFMQIGAFEQHGITMQSSGEIGCIWQKSK